MTQIAIDDSGRRARTTPPGRDGTFVPTAAQNVPEGVRPSFERAAAAAVLAGVVPGRPQDLPESWPTVEEPERHLRLVDPKERTPEQQRRRTRYLLVGGALMAVAVAFVLVYVHVVMAQRQFQLDKLNSEVQQQQASYQNLRLQVAELGSPAHIIATAEGKLGMVPPSAVSYLTPSQTIAGSNSGPAASPATSSVAPAGDADWPKIKSQLAGSP